MTSAQITAQSLGQVTDNIFQMLVGCHFEVTVIQKQQRGIKITNHMVAFYGVKVGVLFSVLTLNNFSLPPTFPETTAGIMAALHL